MKLNARVSVVQRACFGEEERCRNPSGIRPACAPRRTAARVTEVKPAKGPIRHTISNRIYEFMN
jgi:hypothetical protein